MPFYLMAIYSQSATGQWFFGIFRKGLTLILLNHFETGIEIIHHCFLTEILLYMINI